MKKCLQVTSLFFFVSAILFVHVGHAAKKEDCPGQTNPLACQEMTPAPTKKRIAPTPKRVVPAKKQIKRASKVKSIVFIGKMYACNCTKKRIAQSWLALTNTLKGYTPIAIKRINLDVNKKEAQRLRKIAPFFVIPGIYMFDKKGGLVKMLQGKITQTQFAKVF